MLCLPKNISLAWIRDKSYQFPIEGSQAVIAGNSSKLQVSV